ncbi:MAG TPA: DUF4292 domain-containing protein [Flavobacterium sp.]|nr:DUF4292 domain-containing protein [Flavobacterium sp.]
MKKYIGLVLLVFIVSCKSAKTAVTEGSANVDKKMPLEKIIRNHYANNRNFVTAYIKASVKYRDENNTQNVTTEIRIKKNEMILVSIRLLGITMAKALITPTEVKYYEKINGKYFEGNYAALGQFVGTDLDFEKVQNLLIGQALDDLKTGEYKTSIEGNLYKLQNMPAGNTTKEYFFESMKFLLRKQTISQAQQQRTMQVVYPDYMQNNGVELPTGLVIDADQKKGKTNINITYNSVTFNEAMTFPYSVPEGYERIFIN